MRHRLIPVRLIPLLLALGLAACGDDSTVPSAGEPTTTSTNPTGPSTTMPDGTGTATTSTITTSTITTGTMPTSTMPTSTMPTSTIPTSSDATEPTMTTPPTGSSVDIAVADLADRLDIAPDEIDVVSVEEVTWPDGSLGCPEPGMVYTQALVNGQRIVLDVDGTTYEYHSGGSRAPFFCPAKYVQPPAPDGSTDPDL